MADWAAGANPRATFSRLCSRAVKSPPTLTCVVAVAPQRDATRDVVSRLLTLLAERGADGRNDALRLVLEALPGARSLTLRPFPAGPVEAAASRGGVADLRAVSALDVPVRRGGSWAGVLAAVATTPFTPDQAALLQVVATALVLVSPAPGPSPLVAAQAVLDAEADLALVAAELDETVAESLVALRHTDPAQVRVAATAALAELRKIGRELRAAALDDGLRAALGELRERGSTVHASDPALDAVPPAIAVLVERVAEAVCRQVGGRTRITASVDEFSVKLQVESADNAIDASELERWRRRAHALRGELRHWPGGVELSLPTAPGNEGRHDDRLDL